VSLACASAPIQPAGYQTLARADGLVLDGCYDCLLDARTIYQQLAVGRARPIVLPRLLETELLVALREKELALEAEPALSRAPAIAAELITFTLGDAPYQGIVRGTTIEGIVSAGNGNRTWKATRSQ